MTRLARGPRLRRRRAASFAVLLLAAATGLGQATAGGQAEPGSGGPDRPRVEFTPTEFGAGEEVQAVLVLTGLDFASGFALKPGSGLPSSEDPELREVSLARTPRGWELKIRFVPWSPGPGRIPSISAKGAVLPSVPYVVASRLGPAEREISPPRPQREPPGTALYLYGIAGAALLLVLATVGSVAYLVPAGRALLARWKAAQAYRQLCRSLDYLSAGASVSEPAAFYAALSRALRLYLAARVDGRAPALTASEIAALPSSAFPASGLRDEAAAVFAEAETARYAGESPGPELMRETVRRARDLATAAEEALDARL